MKQEESDALAGFFGALGYAIRELDDIPGDVRQRFLDRLAHYVKRMTTEQVEVKTFSEIEASIILKLHLALLETVHGNEPRSDSFPLL